MYDVYPLGTRAGAAVADSTPYVRENLKLGPGGETGPINDMLRKTAEAFAAKRQLRSSRNVGQPKHILPNPIRCHKPERRPGPGEIRRALPEHDGVQVDAILIDQA